jgi:epoxyqueuosine reductase
VLTSSDIKRRALALGFDLCGISPVDTFPELGALPSWLRRGYAGTMTYLNRTARVRADVRRILPSARSVVMVACNYNVERPYSTEIADPREAIIARYAWGEDYHHVMARRLDALLAWMETERGAGFEGRRYVDSGPVQERVYAQHAGLGWIGKNACLINPEIGSWILLGEVISNLDLDPDAPGVEQCGRCGLCLEACPTGALVAPHVLDARRCLSYLTIELGGSVPDARRSEAGARVFGCDVCQDVCPWNGTAARSECREWMPRPGLDRRQLLDLWSTCDADLSDLVSQSALERPGLPGLRRNLAVALGNSGDPAAAGALAPDQLARRRHDSPSLCDPRVAEHAAWAAKRLRR